MRIWLSKWKIPRDEDLTVVGIELESVDALSIFLGSDLTVVGIELESVDALAIFLGSLDFNLLLFDVCPSQFSHLLESDVLGTDTSRLVFV